MNEAEVTTGWRRGKVQLTAVRLLEGDDAVAVAVEERRVLRQRRRAGALRVAERRRRPAHFTVHRTRNARIQQTESPEKATRTAEAELTNRRERRREAAKAQPPPVGTPVVAEPCPSPFSGDSPSTGAGRARELANCSPLSFLAVCSARRSWPRGSCAVRVAVPPRAPPPKIQVDWPQPQGN